MVFTKMLKWLEGSKDQFVSNVMIVMEPYGALFPTIWKPFCISIESIFTKVSALAIKAITWFW